MSFYEKIDEFILSGVTENPCFHDVLMVHRLTKNHYYINGIPSDLIVQALDDEWYFRDMPNLFPKAEPETIMEMVTYVKDRKSDRPLSHPCSAMRFIKSVVQLVFTLLELGKDIEPTDEEKVKYNKTLYLKGLGFSAGSLSRMAGGNYNNQILFYIALAMYLSIPTTKMVEEFINQFGYSLNSPVKLICQKKITVSGKPVTFNFYGKDFKKWFDSGIDYFLIFQLLSKDWGSECVE